MLSLSIGTTSSVITNPVREIIIPSNFLFEDNFSDVLNTPLTSHTPDTGTGWSDTAFTQTGTDPIIIDSTDRLIMPSGSAVYYGQITPNATAADCKVGGVFYRNSTSTSTGVASIFARALDQGTRSGYFLEIFPTSISLVKFVNNSGTTLDSTSYSWTVGTEKDIYLEIIGSSIRVVIDDVETLTATDTQFSAAGLIGVGGRLYNSADIRVSSFFVEEL